MTYPEGSHGGTCSFRPLCWGLASVLTLCLQQQHGVFLPGRAAWLKALLSTRWGWTETQSGFSYRTGNFRRNPGPCGSFGPVLMCKRTTPPPHAPVGFDCFLPRLISLQCRWAASSACVWMLKLAGRLFPPLCPFFSVLVCCERWVGAHSRDLLAYI